MKTGSGFRSHLCRDIKYFTFINLRAAVYLLCISNSMIFAAMSPYCMCMHVLVLLKPSHSGFLFTDVETAQHAEDPSVWVLRESPIPAAPVIYREDVSNHQSYTQQYRELYTILYSDIRAEVYTDLQTLSVGCFSYHCPWYINTSGAKQEVRQRWVSAPTVSSSVSLPTGQGFPVIETMIPE